MKTLSLTPKTTFFSAATTELNTLLKQKQLSQLVRSSLIVLGVVWILFGSFYHLFPPQIPFLYSRPWGETQLIPKQYFFVIPSLLTALFVVHIRIASKFLAKNKMLTYIILWTQILIEFLIFIALLKIIVLLA